MLNFKLFNTNLQLQVHGEVTGAGMQLRAMMGTGKRLKMVNIFSECVLLGPTALLTV